MADRAITWGGWWMTTDPIRLDDVEPLKDYYAVNYMAPASGPAFGGLRRDRPAPTKGPYGVDPGYQLADAREEVRRQVASGATVGFLNVNSAPLGEHVLQTDQQNAVRARSFAQACAEHPTFRCVLAPDVGTGGHEIQTAEEFAAWMLELAPGAHRLDDGCVLLTPYMGQYDASKRWWQAGWWLEVRSAFAAQGEEVAIVPVPNSLPDEAMDALWSLVDGWSIWGGRSTGANDWVTDACNRMRARPLGRNRIWIHPVSAGQAVPKAGRFDEGGGFDQVLATLRQAQELCTGPDDMAVVLTLNDFHEGTAVGPSMRCKGTAYLDVCDRYLSGKSLEHDWIGLAYRGQLVAPTELVVKGCGPATDGYTSQLHVAPLTEPQARLIRPGAWAWTPEGEHVTFTDAAAAGETVVDVLPLLADAYDVLTVQTWPYLPDYGVGYRPMVNAGHMPWGPPDGTPTEDTVSVLAYLAGPATLNVRYPTRATYDLDAGEHLIKVPSRIGAQPYASLYRHGHRIASVQGPERVLARPRLQDLTYLTATASVR